MVHKRNERRPYHAPYTRLGVYRERNVALIDVILTHKSTKILDVDKLHKTRRGLLLLSSATAITYGFTRLGRHYTMSGD